MKENIIFIEVKNRTSLDVDFRPLSLEESEFLYDKPGAKLLKGEVFYIKIRGGVE